MKVLHVAPDDSAGGNLREALRIAGQQQEVLSFIDDLSCGPIAWGTARERAAWWSHVHAPLQEEDLTTFWHRVERRLHPRTGRQGVVERSARHRIDDGP